MIFHLNKDTMKTVLDATFSTPSNHWLNELVKAAVLAGVRPECAIGDVRIPRRRLGRAFNVLAEARPEALTVAEIAKRSGLTDLAVRNQIKHLLDRNEVDTTRGQRKGTGPTPFAYRLALDSDGKGCGKDLTAGLNEVELCAVEILRYITRMRSATRQQLVWQCRRKLETVTNAANWLVEVDLLQEHPGRLAGDLLSYTLPTPAVPIEDDAMIEKIAEALFRGGAA